MSKIKERPIIMSGDNPKLILDGSKTQTRRIEGGSMPDIAADCPCGVAGDRLWVRETWCRCVDGLPNDGRPIGPDGWGCLYRSSDRDAIAEDEDGEPRWHPSIHMPRWASRITLEITRVRVERVRDISEEDAIAEGVKKISRTSHSTGETRGTAKVMHGSAYGAYASLWDSLHGKGAWERNDWVWAITFKLVK